MKIAVIAKKGGVGKSTLSLMLYEALRQTGRNVAIQDWDTQGTASSALDRIGGTKATPGGNYDVLIYDTPPSLRETATLTAVKDAEIVLIVTSPALADMWEAEDAVAMAKRENPAATVRLMVNKMRKGTTLTRMIEDSIKRARISTEQLESSLSYRECYQHAIGGGWNALDSTARTEVL